MRHSDKRGCKIHRVLSVTYARYQCCVYAKLLSGLKGPRMLFRVKASQENLWQRMIQLSEFFQYSFVLIRKRKCLVGVSRVRCGRVVLLQLLFIHDGAVGITNLDVMLLCTWVSLGPPLNSYRWVSLGPPLNGYTWVYPGLHSTVTHGVSPGLHSAVTHGCPPGLNSTVTHGCPQAPTQQLHMGYPQASTQQLHMGVPRPPLNSYTWGIPRPPLNS